MEMDVVLPEPFGIETELLRVRAHPGERRLRGLLHHVAELSCARQPALARIGGRLEEEHVAADGGERKPGGDARIGYALAHLAFEPAWPEPRAQPPLVDAKGLGTRFPFRDPARGLAQHVAQASF